MLLSLSAYGKTLENLSKHSQVRYTDDSSKLVNNPLFKSQTVIADDIMEVEMGKKRVNWNLPLHVGLFVYSYAKLFVLRFFYELIKTYFTKDDYELCEMDTDSLYLMISGQSLDDIVKEDKRKDFYQAYQTWFPSPACEYHYAEVVDAKCCKEQWDVSTKECCRKRLLADKRTPGIFKVEYEGDGIVALTSKTYFCFKNNTDDEGPDEVDIKLACKGLNKRTNDLTKNHYLDVLKTQINGGGINKGFKVDQNNTILTYEQKRSSLSYLYIKRKVGKDGITTTPLDI